MTQPYTLEFTIHDLPKTPNQLLGAHWRVRSGHAKKWTTAVKEQVHQFKPAQPLTSAVLTFTRVSSGRLDDDGLSGSFKAVKDALKKNGIIQDDSPKFVRSVYLHELGSPGKGHIKVKIEEVIKPKEVA